MSGEQERLGGKGKRKKTVEGEIRNQTGVREEDG